MHAQLDMLIRVRRMIGEGKLRPDALRRARAAGDRKLLLQLAIVAACIAYVAAFSDSARHAALIVKNIVALPLLAQLVRPRGWIHSVVVVSLAAAAWLYEGMREIFVGLALFQAVPSLVREIGDLGARRGRRGLARGLQLAMWLAAFVGIAVPILGIAGAVFLNPHVFEVMIRDSHQPRVQVLWAAVGVLETLMGIGGSADGASSDPYRVLGLSLHASERDIQRRWRTLSMQYHPDKTGNDPLKTKHFLRLQKAMQVLLSGKSKKITSTSKDIMSERLLGLVSKAVSSALVVCIWIVVSAWAALRRPATGAGGEAAAGPDPADERLRLQLALSDPRVRSVLADPAMREVIQLCVSGRDPEALRERMKDEGTAAGVDALVDAGLFRRDAAEGRDGAIAPDRDALVAAGLIGRPGARGGGGDAAERPEAPAAAAAGGAFAPTRVGGARRRKGARAS